MHYFFLTFLLLLSGCSLRKMPDQPLETQHIVTSSVVRSTAHLDQHLSDFSKFFIYQNEKFKLPDRSVIEISDQVMSREIYIDWSGPVSTLLKELSAMVGYRYQAIGPAPAIPAIVTLHHEKIALVDVFRDVALQAHLKADIALFPDEKLIELRYKG